MKRAQLLALGAIVFAALVGALLYLLLGAETEQPTADPSARGPSSPVADARPRASRAQAPPEPSSAASPAPSVGAGPRSSAPPARSPRATPSDTESHRATLRLEVSGSARPVSVDVAWETHGAEGQSETRWWNGRTDASGDLRVELSWIGDSSYPALIRVRDERGREAHCQVPLSPGATLHRRLELPQTPILDVRKPVASAARVTGTVHVYVDGQRRESPGSFRDEGGERVVVSPQTTGACRVVVTALLYDDKGRHQGRIYGEQQVDLRPGQRTLVDPTYVAMARVRVQVMSPSGTVAASSQFALRCGVATPHDCLEAHQGDRESLGGGFGFADEEEEAKEEPPDPAPLLESRFGESEVFVYPGAWEVVATGPDPSLARGRASFSVKAGEVRTVQVRLEQARAIEVQIPEVPPSDETRVTIEGPPGAHVHLEEELLRIEGLQEGDPVRVTLRRRVGETAWGARVVLSPGAKHDARFVQAGVLELELRRPDGSPREVEWSVAPKPAPGLGSYRLETSTEDGVIEAWLAGDRQGRWGRVDLNPISSVVDSDEEGGLHTLAILPGEHVITLERESGPPELIPVTIRSGQRVRIKR